MAVVDASVQVALFNDADPHHGAVTSWYRHSLADGEPLAAPWLLVAEAAAALSRGLGDSHLARRAVKKLVSDEQVRLVAVDKSLAERAAQIAADHGLRGCDAVYVALAATLGEPLVTLDRDQAERAADVTTVITPGVRPT